MTERKRAALRKRLLKAAERNSPTATPEQRALLVDLAISQSEEDLQSSRTFEEFIDRQMETLRISRELQEEMKIPPHQPTPKEYAEVAKMIDKLKKIFGETQ